jgi:hypothetical protein
MRVSGAGQRALQIPHQVFDRPVLLAGYSTQWPPVVRLRLDSDGVEQHGGWHVMRVRDEWNAHPGPNRLILEVQPVRAAAGPEAEDKCAGNRYAKRHGENQ